MRTPRLGSRPAKGLVSSSRPNTAPKTLIVPSRAGYLELASDLRARLTSGRAGVEGLLRRTAICHVDVEAANGLPDSRPKGTAALSFAAASSSEKRRERDAGGATMVPDISNATEANEAGRRGRPKTGEQGASPILARRRAAAALPIRASMARSTSRADLKGRDKKLGHAIGHIGETLLAPLTAPIKGIYFVRKKNQTSNEPFICLMPLQPFATSQTELLHLQLNKNGRRQNEEKLLN